MLKKAKSGVSATAELTCLLRAKSYGEKRPQLKCDDYVAVILSQTFHSFFSMIQKTFLLGDDVVNLATPVGIYPYIVARTLYIDQIVQKTAGRFSKIFILGAGYDSRAIRFHHSLQHSRIFEIDHPTMQQNKIEKLAKAHITPPSNLTFIPLDFNQQNLADTLAALPLQPGEKCLFLLEGLLMYLTHPQVKSLFSAISDYSSDGSQIIFDFVYDHLLVSDHKFVATSAMTDEYGVKESVEGVRSLGEEWTFGIAEKGLDAFLKQYGLTLLDRADARELEKRFFTDNQGKCLEKINTASCLVYATREIS
ncbi:MULTISPECIES: class I SAM-dependent methyltransferase [Yersinia]|uniref:S-adenosyl-L-methionine-dependent methyltransferase n=1 Tax=Yersinia frederiksenii TaxID=29484 RepID=A0AAI9EQJ6_YERFR|nr:MULTISPECIES: SAM-dependent methyltransferase [Yersinia]MDN0125786.1 SAM-dependent methyltransferase [Yersinia massiliensis]CFR10679.1 O-methyltransferase involved in polyketide biosynthesis [Yersinia frederiksenii]HEI6963504.1 class I SAM-dependent methyltransferase [Yersinia enterocolitica]